MKETLIAIEESVKSLATEDRLKKIREERLSITKGINKKFETKKEKIESHITSCMQNHYSWQPVQSYPN